jgi:hypothetical protein
MHGARGKVLTVEGGRGYSRKKQHQVRKPAFNRLLFAGNRVEECA